MLNNHFIRNHTNCVLKEIIYTAGQECLITTGCTRIIFQKNSTFYKFLIS